MFSDPIVSTTSFASALLKPLQKESSWLGQHHVLGCHGKDTGVDCWLETGSKHAFHPPWHSSNRFSGVITMWCNFRLSFRGPKVITLVVLERSLSGKCTTSVISAVSADNDGGSEDSAKPQIMLSANVCFLQQIYIQYMFDNYSMVKIGKDCDYGKTCLVKVWLRQLKHVVKVGKSGVHACDISVWTKGVDRPTLQLVLGIWAGQRTKKRKCTIMFYYAVLKNQSWIKIQLNQTGQIYTLFNP